LADMFSNTPDLTPYTPIMPQQDMNEMNAKNSAAGEMSKGLDFSKPDRIDDDVFNRILWRMVKGDEAFPVVGAKSPMHALVMSRESALGGLADRRCRGGLDFGRVL